MKQNTAHTYVHAVLATLFLAAAFASCASTPIRDVTQPEEYSVRQEPQEASEARFDFIGFKSNINLLAMAASSSAKDSFLLDLLGGSVEHDADYASGYEYWRDFRDAVPMRRLPYRLSQLNIASDESALYFGDFSPQDLAVYSGNHRYVTFVDVIEAHLGWMDSGRMQKAFASTGGILSITGAAGFLTLFDNGLDIQNLSFGQIAGLALSGAGVLLGQLCLIPSFIKPKTAFSAHIKYALCVYDTQEKKLIKRKTVDFKKEDTFTGSFESSKTDKSRIYEYFSKCLANDMLREFQKL